MGLGQNIDSNWLIMSVDVSSILIIIGSLAQSGCWSKVGTQVWDAILWKMTTSV